LSKTFPQRVFKNVGVKRRYIGVESFSYADDILVIGNNKFEFGCYIDQFKLLLSKLGLNFDYSKTNIYHNINRKVKFIFLGFEFIVMPREQLRKSRLLSNLNNLHSLQNGIKGFGIIFKPTATVLLEVKKKLKKAIS